MSCHTNAEHTFISAVKWPFAVAFAVSSIATYNRRSATMENDQFVSALVLCGQLGVSGPCATAACLGEVR